MKVLVTGGAGYIGAHVVRTIAQRRHEPVILDDLRCSSEKRVKGFIWEKTALEDTAGVLEVFRRHRPDAVIHLAGYISVAESVERPEKYWENNLGAAGSLLTAIARYPVRSFLFSSTAATYGNAGVSPIPEACALTPTCPYGSSKLAFEKVLHAHGRALGFRSFALRYFNAAGACPEWGVGEDHEPEEHLIPRVIAAIRAGRRLPVYGRDYPTPDGTCVRDFIHVADLASAHVKVVEQEDLDGGLSLNVGTGKGASVLEVAHCIARQMGVEPAIEYLPRRAGDPASLIADPALLMQKTDWRPEHSSLEEIVASAIAWDRQRIGL
jgi:UDP-glucose-4-epimerase GalE